MPFRDVDRKHVVKIARVAKMLLSDHEDADSIYRDFQSSVLKMMCRWLEMFIEPKVSFRAEEAALNMGIGIDTLRGATWRNQSTILKDPNRQIFHLEHVVPVRELVGRVLELHDASVDEIAQVLLTAEIAWITKDEDRKLTKLGFRSKRPDPKAAYDAAKIVFSIEASSPIQK